MCLPLSYRHELKIDQKKEERKKIIWLSVSNYLALQKIQKYRADLQQQAAECGIICACYC
jgi:hypothetical protein